MYDAILIPGGGVQPNGTPPPWVRSRLDAAVAAARAEYLITLSAGTLHKPPPMNAYGFPIYESVAAAQYLISKGVPANRLLTETCSWDTIGNAYFGLTIHLEPRGFRRLLIVTSEFHMPRAQAIFEWVCALGSIPRSLDFVSVPNDGLEEPALSARREKEERGVASVKALALKLGSLAKLHDWLYSEHDAYRSNGHAHFGDPTNSDAGKSLKTY